MNYDIEREILAATRKPHACEYGALGLRCGADAWTSRLRPNRDGYWWVCARHGEFLDRLRASVERHRPLLDRIARGPSPEGEQT